MRLQLIISTVLFIHTLAYGELVWRPLPGVSDVPSGVLQKTPMGYLTDRGELSVEGELKKSIRIEGKTPYRVAWWDEKWWALEREGTRLNYISRLWRSNDRENWVYVRELSDGYVVLEWNHDRLLMIGDTSIAWINRRGQVVEGQIPDNIMKTLGKMGSGAIGKDGIVVSYSTDEGDWKFLKFAFKGTVTQSNATPKPSEIFWFDDQFLFVAGGTLWTSADGITWNESRSFDYIDYPPSHISVGGGQIMIGTSDGLLWWGGSLDNLTKTQLPTYGENYRRIHYNGEYHLFEVSTRENEWSTLNISDPLHPEVIRFGGNREVLSSVRWNERTYFSFPGGAYMFSKGEQTFVLDSFPYPEDFVLSTDGNQLYAIGDAPEPGNNTRDVILRSSNGRDWMTLEIEGITGAQELEYASGSWWIRGYFDELWISSDLEQFELVELPSEIIRLADIQAALGQLFILGNNDQGVDIISRTSDGVAWDTTQVSVSGTKQFNRIAGDEDEVFIFSGNTRVNNDPLGLWRSPDGNQWSRIEEIKRDVSAFYISDDYYLGTMSSEYPHGSVGFFTRDFKTDSIQTMGIYDGGRVHELVEHDHGALAVTGIGISWLSDYSHLWRLRTFGTTNEDENPYIGDYADPDGDGYDNILERFLVMDPMASSRPEIRISRWKTQEGLWMLNYGLLANPRDQGYFNVSISSDLIEWSTFDPFEKLGNIGPDELRVGLPADQAPLYLRFSIKEPPPEYFSEDQ